MPPALLNTSKSEILVEKLAIADHLVARMVGLLGRKDLAPSDGLLIKPCNAIHMMFMNFAIDAVFLDRDLQVLKIIHELRPWRMTACAGAAMVLELRAGTAAYKGLEPGHRLALTKSSQLHDITLCR